ncbi:MAG: PilZ domain-containing protein [Acidobacteria bacterium]|nr:PilZ domain-containing protein [Acidobacteriota bacterium]
MSNPERRNFVRIDKKSLVSYTLLHPDKAELETGMGRSTDLSLKGLQLELPKDVSTDDLLSLTLSIDGSLISVSGRVAWVEHEEDHGTRVGLEILSVPAEYEQEIQKLLMHRTNP